MSKASPLVRSFNAGEMSPLLWGRTDIDRYPASCRSLLNCVATPQGPSISRSGTEYTQAVYNHAKKSALFPFSVSETENYMIEFADARCRFFTEDGGILIYAPTAATMVTQSPFVLTDATLAANVGDEVVLSGWPPEYNLNGEVAKITAKATNDYTLDIVHPALPDAVGISLARVYHIVSPYTEAMLQDIRGLQIIDVVRIVNKFLKPQKLKRNDTYNWTFEAITFKDGPYFDTNEEATKFTLSASGRATPNMTSDSAPATWATSSSGVTGTNAAWKAFDDPSTDTFWESNTDQTGTLTIQAPAAFVCDGYTIYGANNSTDISYLSKDYAPSTWEFEGSNDGSTWFLLDAQRSHVLYNKQRTPFFPIKNTTAYSYYRIVVRSLVRNGPIKPRIKSLVLSSPSTKSGITLTASSVVGINNGAGFKTTDVGRFIRMKGTDGIWRSLVITAHTNTTVVTVTLIDEPFLSAEATADWRLGYWSDTTGWPNTIAYYQDRMWYGGSDAVPDLIVGSTTEYYENMAPSDPDGVVVDTNSIVNILNSRKRSRLMWLAANEKGFLAGTGSQEFVIASDGTNKTLTPGTTTAKESSARGSANVEPVVVDKAVLFLQRAARTMRENAWVYEADGFKAPSMSNLASHLGASPFAQMVFASEPYSIVWLRRTDGKLIGMTYNRDENVIGWHRHDVSGGFVESMAVLPSSNGLQDTLWMIVRRTINGNTRRYIEKLTRFWDFNMTIEEAHFVDCGLRYVGAEDVSLIYGLQHLENNDVYGLADNIPFGPKRVQAGSIELDTPARNVVVGLGFESLGETAALENGAQDGTAIGKTKRTNRFVLNVWQSYGGEVGTFNEDKNEIMWTPVEYPVYDLTTIEDIDLFDGLTKPVTPAPGYERKGSVYFRRTKEQPLPFNVVSMMTQLTTQDG